MKTPYYRKHAKGEYELTFPVKHGLSYEGGFNWLNSLCKYPEYEDLKQELNIVLDTQGYNHGEDNYIYITMKSDIETFKLVIDILSDHKYYNLTEFTNLINEIEE